jgi:hypothetical protein
MFTIPFAGAVKLYHTSPAPGAAQLGVPKFAVFVKYADPTVVPLVEEHVAFTVNDTAVQGVSP